MRPYEPRPIDTASVALSPELTGLIERLAENAHDVWGVQRIGDGWRYGQHRNDASKEHPCLVPYDQLPEAEKEYDRKMARATLSAVVALGYRIVPPNEDNAGS